MSWLSGVGLSLNAQDLFDADPPVVLNGTVSWDNQNVSPLGGSSRSSSRNGGTWRCIDFSQRRSWSHFRGSTSAADKESRPGVYHGYSEARYDGWVKSSQYVTVKDGTRFAVDIFRPAQNGVAAAGRFPVIWTHTPYRRSTLRPDGKPRARSTAGDSSIW